MKLQSKTNELPEYLHGRKASEVFLEYAMPAINMLLEGTGNKLNIKELENMLVIPSCIWNKVVAETDTNTNIDNSVTDILLQVDQILRHNIPPGGEEWLHFLRQRKIIDFKKYHYYIKYTVHRKNNNELGVQVEHAPANYNNVVKF